ncbi:SRPBCC family protein [Ornithinimicrobium sp. F0845]|uniref:SRPBCC family protein n=1 Tax=Ornithinimicrobium sp. F0845 TaxID=2926412 RepID=UPI001FF24712|nr:SRPBCC family protein [Ornithinimicrobium sp. F0845]MCK0111675.1 SRPBCC family protein [Ornithinimicrobium sp. F0845]
MADRTESSILIPAPPSEVIEVISDFDNYPAWADFKSVQILSENEGGWADEVEFSLEAGVVRDTYVLAYDWQITETGEGQVSWDLVRAGTLKAMTGSYALTAVDMEGAPDGIGTEVVYQLQVDVKIPMLGAMKRKAEKMIVDTALSSLSDRVLSRG